MPVITQGRKRDRAKRDRSWVQYLLEKWKYFILLYLRSAVDAKQAVEIRYSIRHAARIRRKVRSGVS